MYAEVLDARRACLAFSALGLVLSAASARADVKIVSDVTVTRQSSNDGDSGVPATQTVTTYYKGRYARVEVAGGLVTLYNDDAGRVYTLDPAARTYYVLPLKQVQEGQEGAGSEDSNLDVKLDLKSPDGAETRSYAGLTAREYNVTGSISPKPREGRTGGPLGGIFGGGGFPGGVVSLAGASPAGAATAGVGAGEAAVKEAVKAGARRPGRRSAARSGCPTPRNCPTTRRRPHCRRRGCSSPGAARP